MSEEDRKKRTYEMPIVTRVKLEDKPVVAMAVCKDSVLNLACADALNNPTLEINAS